jgi:hypothetical protein
MNSDFEELFPREEKPDAEPPLIVRRKPIRERIAFAIANWLLITPFVCLIYSIVVAKGLRMVLPVMQTRISKFPIPGAHVAERFEGFHRIDLAFIVALALYFLVTWIWMRIFLELLGHGTVMELRRRSPIAAALLGFIGFLFILMDGGLFYFGMKAEMHASWTDAPAIVVPAATLAYSAGAALIGWIHADHRISTSV